MVTAISLFSGIGGVDCGFKMAGIDLLASVEFDIENKAFSEECRDIHSLNFPNSDFYLEPVAKVADLLPGCDILQASPVCKHFSMAASLNGSEFETLYDTAIAKDTATAIKRCNPSYFLLEQVPGYLGSRSLGIIEAALEGYKINKYVVDFADYGIAQNRKRLILLASRGESWGLPPYQRPVGWKEAIAGIPLEPSTLTSRQRQALLKKVDKGYDLDRGILVQRVGISLSIRTHDQPCWTITRSVFVDDRGNPRRNVITVVNSKGIWNLPTRAIARLSGFPDSYDLGQGRLVGQGLGYCVPPRFVHLLCEKF